MKLRAFTLIELLVVIAIIAILAAILFPVFAQAKLAAKTTGALSNIKQLAIGVQMYASDYDDGTVLTDYEPTTYNRPTWAYLLLPYTKNKEINWDPARAIDPNEKYGDYYWDAVTTIAINDAGFSGYWSGNCQDPFAGPYVYGRKITSIENLAERSAFMTDMWQGTNVGWYYFRNYEANWIDTSMEYSEWSWYNQVWQTRLAHSGKKIPTAYGDGHASKVGREKFVSWDDAPDRTTLCQIMVNNKLDRFWGVAGDATQ